MNKDFELLKLAKNNDKEAIQKLLKKYNKLIYINSKKYVYLDNLYKEDYINEAVLSFYKAINKFEGIDGFELYLNKAINNTLINYNKSINKKRNIPNNKKVPLEDIEKYTYFTNEKKYNPEKIVFEESNYNELKKDIIDKLTWKEELIFTLKEQNFTIKEISEITDNNLRTVYNIINRVKNKISNLCQITLN